MIPETCANKTIELYKCLEFPFKWELQQNLMENLDAVDTTIHFHNGKYWMFVNIKENKGASNCDELFLFIHTTEVMIPTAIQVLDRDGRVQGQNGVNRTNYFNLFLT